MVPDGWMDGRRDARATLKLYLSDFIVGWGRGASRVTTICKRTGTFVELCRENMSSLFGTKTCQMI